MDVREIRMSDLDRVAAIESLSFPRPWTEKTLYQDLKRNVRSRFFVAEVEGRVVGHVGLWKRREDVHITTLAVHPDYRRRGVASGMIRYLFDRYPEADFTLEVRRSNDAARALYEGLGFRVTGRRPDYYADNGEAALVMSSHADAREEIVEHGAVGQP